MGVGGWVFILGPAECLTRGSPTERGSPGECGPADSGTSGPKTGMGGDLKIRGADSCGYWGVGSKSEQRRSVRKTPEVSHMWEANGEEKPGWLAAQKPKMGTS